MNELNSTPKRWSDTLQAQTRDAIQNAEVNPHTGQLHLKHSSGSFGCIDAIDLLSNKLTFQSGVSGEHIEFEDINSLLSAGWAID